MKLKSILILSCFVLAACNTGAQPAATAIPTVTPIPTKTFTALPPTVTPVPVTSEPAADLQADLKSTWQPALSGGLVIYATCPMILDTANRRTAETIDAETAYGELFSEGLMLSGVTGAFAEWKPIDPQVINYKEILEADLNNLRDVVSLWSGQEIDAAGAAALLTEQCPQVEAHLGAVVAAAQAAGMTEETLNTVLLEFQETMAEMTVSE